jgi:hypothetical protein
MSAADFDRIVVQLKTVALRGQESISRAVELVAEYQVKVGKSEQQLKRLADAVGVTTRTIYRWKNLVANPKPKAKKVKAETQTESFYVIRKKSDNKFAPNESSVFRTKYRFYELGEAVEYVEAFDKRLQPEIVKVTVTARFTVVDGHNIL